LVATGDHWSPVIGHFLKTPIASICLNCLAALEEGGQNVENGHSTLARYIASDRSVRLRVGFGFFGKSMSIYMTPLHRILPCSDQYSLGVTNMNLNGKHLRQKLKCTPHSAKVYKFLVYGLP
jgi:hypothetical protein